MQDAAAVASGVAGWMRYGAQILFYIAPPSAAVASVEQVPHYIREATPFFFLGILVELIVGAIRGKKYYRLNDTFSSVSAGMVQQIVYTVLHKTMEAVTYIWAYERINVIHLPWNSALTWWVCFIGVDCGYYWFHRMAHEINIFWAAHVVHHSSEDYNLSTALRQSMLQRYTSFIFYMPLAVAIPPSVFAAHRQFNTLYQFWLHTRHIRSIGPLELVLNTPSHHRVHHGRNPYCIDKNYGARGRRDSGARRATVKCAHDRPAAAPAIAQAGPSSFGIGCLARSRRSVSRFVRATPRRRSPHAQPP